MYRKEIRNIREIIARIRNKKTYHYKQWHELDARLGHFRNELEKTLDLARG